MFTKEQIEAVTAYAMKDEEVIRAITKISEKIIILVSAIARGIQNEIIDKGGEL